MSYPGGSRAADALSVYSILGPVGGLQGLSVVNKFGRNTDVDTAAAEDIWSGGNNANATALYPFLTSAVPLYISSDDGTDTQDIEIQGLDENNDIQVVTQTLAGQTKTLVTAPLDWLRVFRARNLGSALTGTVYIYSDDTVTAGVPDTATTTKAIIEPSDGQTMMAVYSVPRNTKAIITSWMVSIKRDSAVQDRYLTATLRVSEAGQSKTNPPIKDSIQLSAAGGVLIRPFYPGNCVTGPADILIRADEVSSNDSTVTGAFDLWLVEDTFTESLGG